MGSEYKIMNRIGMIEYNEESHEHRKQEQTLPAPVYGLTLNK